MIQRSDIEDILVNFPVDGDTVSERNEQRRQAVIEFLSSKPNRPGPQGNEHDMILSDLDSYRGWEYESAESSSTHLADFTARSIRPSRGRAIESHPSRDSSIPGTGGS